MRFALVVLSLALSLSPALAAKVTLPGQVTYREKVALPASATLRIQLVDESLPSAPPRLDVEAPIGAGQVPLTFSLSFEDAIIIPDHSYALIAAIRDNGGLLFRNFEPYAVNPLAPASPVVIVTNMLATLVTAPTSSTASAPAAPTVPPDILNSTWTATSIGDIAVPDRFAPTLTLVNALRAGGSGGCNSWFAGVEFDTQAIHFGDLAVTKKSCGDTRDATEHAFFADLAAAASWTIEGNALTLYGPDGKPLLAFAR